MKNVLIAGLIAILGGVALVACGDKPESTGQLKAGGSTSATAQKPAADPLAPRYEATLAEGIDFRKPGYPNFLAEVSGMSAQEPWGRWSNGKLVTFRFKQPLPTKFTLVVSGGAAGTNINQPFLVKAGAVEKEIKFAADPFSKPIPQRLSFQLDAPVNLIEITVPNPSQPSSGDARKIGIGIITLKIE